MVNSLTAQSQETTRLSHLIFTDREKSNLVINLADDEVSCWKPDVNIPAVDQSVLGSFVYCVLFGFELLRCILAEEPSAMGLKLASWKKKKKLHTLIFNNCLTLGIKVNNFFNTFIDEYFAYKQRSRVYWLVYFMLYQRVTVGNEEYINNLDLLCK